MISQLRLHSIPTKSEPRESQPQVFFLIHLSNPKMLPVRTRRLGPARWLSCQRLELLLQRTWLWFPAPTSADTQPPVTPVPRDPVLLTSKFSMLILLCTPHPQSLPSSEFILLSPSPLWSPIPPPPFRQPHHSRFPGLLPPTSESF